MEKLRINMLCMNNEPAGQGVGSATKEQIQLVSETTKDIFDVTVNSMTDGDINHFHQIDPVLYIRMKISSAINVMHVHFLPDTLEGSVSLPKPIFEGFKLYFLDFYKSADYLVVVNPIFIEPLTSFGITKDRIKYIPNYVSRETFHPIEKSLVNEFKDCYNIPKDTFIVIGVGQVQTRKGVNDFIEVAKAIPDVTFVWAGGFSFGAITDGYKDLKEQVEHPPKNVIFTDIIPRDQMNLVYNSADLLFMPSYNELFPMAILEASNSKVPLLLRDLQLYENILFDNYLRGHDNNDFINIINELKKKESLYQQAKNYSEQIEAYYSKENVANQWIDFYTTIGENHKDNHRQSISESQFNAIKEQKQTVFIESSLFKTKPLGNIEIGDTIVFKKMVSISSDKLFVKVAHITYINDETTSERLEKLLKYQDQTSLSLNELKIHSIKNHIVVIEFDNLTIYTDNNMIETQ